MHQIKIKSIEKGAKQYFAIVAGEASDNVEEAQSQGEIIIRRLASQNKIIEEDFVDNIGGAGQYDAVGGKIYNEVMGMSLKDIATSLPGSKYYNRFLGAAKALFHYNYNVSNGACFWNSTCQQYDSNIGFNWRTFDRGTYLKAAEYGGTTFFKYSDVNHKQWP